MARHRGPSGEFLSTPSARRATRPVVRTSGVQRISIHALREEGDRLPGKTICILSISIHALREEGDSLRWSPDC